MRVSQINSVVSDGSRLELDVVVTVASVQVAVVGVVEILPIRKQISDDPPPDR